MDKNDKSRLKLLPAAAVFAAVCITCYQAEKSPVETAAVSDNSVMSAKEIKELNSDRNHRGGDKHRCFLQKRKSFSRKEIKKGKESK